MGMETKNGLTDIKDLKESLLKDIERLLDENSKERKGKISEKLSPLIEEFVNKMGEKGLTVDRGYLELQMEGLKQSINATGEEQNQNLYYAISSCLNRYVQIQESEQDTEEIEHQTKQPKTLLEEECEEDKKSRGEKVENRIIPAIEAYLSDAFSKTIKRATDRNLKISDQTYNELGYEILSTLKREVIGNIKGYIKNEDVQLTREIEGKLQRFFKEVEQVRGTEEMGKQGEDSSTPDFKNHYDIDHKAAIQAAKGKSEETHAKEEPEGGWATMFK